MTIEARYEHTDGRPRYTTAVRRSAVPVRSAPAVPQPRAAGILPGTILHLGPQASVQFGNPGIGSADRSIRFRVIRVHDWTTCEGWMWIDGYQLNAKGDAVERRSVWVMRAGIRILSGGQR